jgi:CspA family cold shock protein
MPRGTLAVLRIAATLAWSTPVSNRPRVRSPAFEMHGGRRMATGIVKKVVSERGFGFITAEDAKDYFFHRSALTEALNFDQLAGGERVEFEVEQDPKGVRARNVRPA